MVMINLPFKILYNVNTEYLPRMCKHIFQQCIIINSLGVGPCFLRS